VSLRDDALATLATWTAWPPSQPGQRALRDRYVAHLREHADGCWRECRPDHVTASTLVLSHDQRAVLLTLHAKAGRWFQVGGHCERGDETLLAAATREAREETGLSGLDLDPLPVHLDEHVVPFCGGYADTHHLDVRFVAVAGPDAVPRASEESRALAWWPVGALPDADLAPLVSAALDRLNAPTARGLEGTS
jgi:8-oxo-dGTP pyrophosphatase MutT (NUDIX family)